MGKKNEDVQINGQQTIEWGDFIFRGKEHWEVIKALGKEGKFLRNNGIFANPSWESAGGGGSGRSDANPVTVNSSAGANIDVISSAEVIMTMNANVSNITPLVDPTVDGFRLRLTYIKGATLYTATVNPAKFADTVSVVHPSPLLLATINTRDHFDYVWSTISGKFNLVGFVLGAY